jgi:hypothetical protein
MRFKGTLILLLVFAALGGYVYFTDFYQKEERQKQEEAKKRLFGGEAKDVEEITLEYEGRTITATRKDEKTWEITNPSGLEADSDTWEQLATSFVEIQKDEVVSAPKTDLVPFGLDKPAIVVRVKLKGGNAAGVLLGSENPKKTFHYAKRTDTDEVFLVSTSNAGSFKKNFTDLRNKKVLDFESDNIDLVRIEAPGKPAMELQKPGSDWQLKKPMDARADAGEVQGFLSSIQFSRASAFADEKVDLKAAGLDMPAVKITLRDQKASRDLSLLFGKSPEKDKYYAKDAARPAIFILATEIIDKARRPVFDWRDKTVVRFGEGGTSAIDEIVISRGTEKLSVKKSDSDWILADGKKAQQFKVSDILSTIDSASALAIIDSPRAPSAYGLDKPKLEVLLREKGKDVATLQIGNESSNPEGVYVKAMGSAILTVNKDLYERLNVKQADLQEAEPSPAPPSK